jgi:hypothetical protein
MLYFINSNYLILHCQINALFIHKNKLLKILNKSNIYAIYDILNKCIISDISAICYIFVISVIFILFIFIFIEHVLCQNNTYRNAVKKTIHCTKYYLLNCMFENPPILYDITRPPGFF